MITVLTGGTGGAKFVDGLHRILPPEELTIIVNTGDDHEWWGLHVSPDLDSITYVLAGILSPERGWGVRDDTFHCLQAMKALGAPSWFSVGDRDLATHLTRTLLLSQEYSLTEATRIISKKFDIKAHILAMSDQHVETRIHTPAGELTFQEYFVKRRYQDPVNSIRFACSMDARPAPGVLDAIAHAEAVFIAPSNPITSIGPILAIPGVREALRETKARIVAVSPLIGTDAVSGPAAALMAAQSLSASIAGVAESYNDFLDTLIVHESDAEVARELSKNGIEFHSADILMRSTEDKIRVAKAALAVARQFRKTVAEAS
jgi:LPPG:FO 2-phospho-L-lactate transferase